MKLSFLLLTLSFLFGNIQVSAKDLNEKLPLVVITDLYHPFNDPGDNLDLINGFALPDVGLKAVILDITDAFRKDTADHPTLWHDPRGPREAGIIPVTQLNYIFNKNIPYAIGPMSLMKSETDKMLYLPAFEQQGVELLLKILKESQEPIQILSFGSARILAVAYNREPLLMTQKVKMIHLSAGTASENFELGSDQGANMIPGGEWNVALDVYAFTRILHSGLPISIYPCAGKDGGYVKDINNTYWRMDNMNFLKEMSPKLQCYIDYALNQRLQNDFLRAMDKGAPYTEGKAKMMSPFHFWETALWLKSTGRELVKEKDGNYSIKKLQEVEPTDYILENSLRPCKLGVRDDGRFQFFYTDASTNIYIYYRPEIVENEKALNAAVPKLLLSY